MALPPYGAPEPDVLLTDAPQGDGCVPLESVAILIEVSDSTISYDLGPKAAMYATHGIPEYWVVDLPAAQIHKFWQPAEGSYRNSRSSAVGKALHSATLPALTIETDGILQLSNSAILELSGVMPYIAAERETRHATTGKSYCAYRGTYSA